MDNRRNLLIALSAALFTPGAVLAQAKKPPVVIGWLNFGSRESLIHHLAAFKEGLAVLGLKEGQQFVIEERWADQRRERLQPLAEGLAARRPAVIVAVFPSAVRAAAKAAPTTPIVLVGGGDPVRFGFAKTLARPGGMITGVSSVTEQLREKYLELLVDAVPKLRRVGVILDNPRVAGPLAGSMEAVRRAAVQRSIELRFEGVSSSEEIEPAVSRLVHWGAQGLVVFSGVLVIAEAARIAKLALDHRLPLSGPGTLTDAASGALLGYGAEGPAMYRRAAYYVDRILKGTKPADLPIELPMTFELVVNLKTAKALGLTMPPEIMVRATRVIQ
jgi:putative ABC transport system substrate-binding protein